MGFHKNIILFQQCVTQFWSKYDLIWCYILSDRNLVQSIECCSCYQSFAAIREFSLLQVRISIQLLPFGSRNIPFCEAEEKRNLKVTIDLNWSKARTCGNSFANLSRALGCILLAKYVVLEIILEMDEEEKRNKHNLLSESCRSTLVELKTILIFF